jgi:O-antigen/teichoic acid export membrane protein
MLGLYSIGSNLASMPLMIFDRLTSNVMQPVYAKLQDIPLRSARWKIRRFRYAMLACFLPPMGFLVLGSYWLFDWLYKPEYLEAYRFCSITALGIILRVSTDMGPLFQAIGQPRKHFHITIARCVAMLLSMWIGYTIGRNLGALYGLAVSPLVSYPFQAILYRKVGMWQPDVDGAGILSAFVLGAMAQYWYV